MLTTTIRVALSIHRNSRSSLLIRIVWLSLLCSGEWSDFELEELHLRITPTHAPNHLTSKFVRWVDGLANKEHEVGRCVVSPDDLQGREFVGMKILDTSPSRVGFQLPPQVCAPNFLSNETRLNSSRSMFSIKSPFPTGNARRRDLCRSGARDQMGSCPPVIF